MLRRKFIDFFRPSKILGAIQKYYAYTVQITFEQFLNKKY